MQKDFNAIFSELLKNFKALNRRVNNFETWEPSTGFVDTGTHAYLTSNQAINTGAWRHVLFDAELWDTDSIHTGSTFTIPEDGKYLFKTLITIGGIAGSFFCRVYKSATEIIQDSKVGTVGAIQVGGIMECSAGDTIIVEVSTSVNTTATGSANGYTTFFQVQRVG